MNTAQRISQNLSWLATIKKDKGYGGPVIHYWQNSLAYIGPSYDWGYEGTIIALLKLFEKTGQKEFLELAKEAGDFLVNNQCHNGSFFNSNFEANPSLSMGGTPHESAACIGLATLCIKLKELKQEYKKYYVTLINNFNKYHMNILFDKTANTFLQYRYDPREYHVPNKIATIGELCLLLHKLTKEKKYHELAKNNAKFIGTCIDEKYGGLKQTDKTNKRIITFYNARCIPFLKIMCEKEKGYEKQLYAAYDFIKEMECKEGGFHFGLIKKENEFEKIKYPQFAAGTADIIRALKIVDGKKQTKHQEWLEKQQNKNGSFRTAVGIDEKNTNNKPTVSWKDVIPVFGWNDKALRLYAEEYKGNNDIITKEIEPIEIQCKEGTYYEDKDIMKINTITFNKQAYFTQYNTLLKTILPLAKVYTTARKRYGQDIRAIRAVCNRVGCPESLKNDQHTNV